VVSHPSQWSFSGYNEIQEPRRKNVLIDYDRLQGLLAAGSYEQLRSSHKGWVEGYLREGRRPVRGSGQTVSRRAPLKPKFLFNWGGKDALR
jgi:putative transposase